MSVELINRITLKKDGIYVSTHSSNDTSTYHSIKVDFLTKAYMYGGIKGLDKAVINMYFEYCDFRGTNESILPYIKAISKAMNDKQFIDIVNETRVLNDKAFDIANRFGDYKDLTKEQSETLYNEFKPEVKKSEDKRNEFVAKIVQEERNSIFNNNKVKKEPKELKDGIYEIIPIHKIDEGHGEIYDEYMNFNSNNGTIIYERRLGNLMPSPECIKISEYLGMIKKTGIDNIGGGNKFMEFIMKYPGIYQTGLDNEFKEEVDNELDKENIEEL